MTDNIQAGPSAPDGEAASQNPETIQVGSLPPDGEAVSQKPETTQEGSSTSDTEAAPPKQELPDGIGIKLDELANLLSKQHDSEVKPDNPILLVASICNAFLGEIRKLHQKQNEALSKVIASRTKDYVDAVKETTKTLDPELPDGIGTKLEDMAVLLSMKHGTTVTLDDPVLMVVSICNSFLGDVQNLNNKHNEALGKIIASRTQEYVAAVKATTESFSQTISTASVEGIRQIFTEHAAALHSSNWNARWCALIMAAGALANLIALAAR